MATSIYDLPVVTYTDPYACSNNVSFNYFYIKGMIPGAHLYVPTEPVLLASQDIINVLEISISSKILAVEYKDSLELSITININGWNYGHLITTFTDMTPTEANEWFLSRTDEAIRRSIINFCKQNGLDKSEGIVNYFFSELVKNNRFAVHLANNEASSHKIVLSNDGVSLFSTNQGTLLSKKSQDLPGVSNVVQDCPEVSCKHVYDFKGKSTSVMDMVMHLNDYHRWTREQIADWIDELAEQGMDFDFKDESDDTVLY